MSRHFTAANTEIVNLGNIPGAEFERATAWTFMAFFRSTLIDAAEKVIVSMGTGGGATRQFLIQVNNGSAPQDLNVEVGNGTNVSPTDNVIELDTWYMVAAACDGSEAANDISLYLYDMDGNVPTGWSGATGTHGGDVSPLTADIQIGQRGSSTDTFDGDIALPIYVKAELSEPEVIAYRRDPFHMGPIFKAKYGTGFHNPLGLDSPEPDWSGNQVTGTLTGSPSASAFPPTLPIMGRIPSLVAIEEVAVGQPMNLRATAVPGARQWHPR